MSDENFVPTTDSSALTERMTRAYGATSDLMQSILNDLDAKRREALDRLLQQGGRVGLEFTVDAYGGAHTKMVGFASDGRRFEMLSVVTLNQTPPH